MGELPAGREPRSHHIGIEAGGDTALRRGVAPFEFVVLGFGSEIAAVPERHLLVEGVAGELQLQFARIKHRGNLEDLEGYGIATRGEGFAVAEDHRDPARPGAGGGERVVHHGSVGLRNVGKGLPTHRAGAAIRFVGAGLGRILDERFEERSERVDGGGPEGVGRGGEALEGSHVSGGEHVEVQIIFAGDFIDELALKHERTLSAAKGIEEEAILEMRWQALEIGFTPRNRGAD